MSEWLRHHNVDVITGMLLLIVTDNQETVLLSLTQRKSMVALLKGNNSSAGLYFSIRLESGKEIECDLVIAAIGVRPTTKLAIDAGLEIGPSGGVRVNSRQQSSGLQVLI